MTCTGVLLAYQNAVFQQHYTQQWTTDYSSVRVAICMLNMSGKCVERCIAVHLNKTSAHRSSQHVHMPLARAPEHKAHTYQNTTHGAASLVYGVHW